MRFPKMSIPSNTFRFFLQPRFAQNALQNYFLNNTPCFFLFFVLNIIKKNVVLAFRPIHYFFLGLIFAHDSSKAKHFEKYMKIN